MQSRTRRLLTGATLVLLAAACAAGLGATKASAASQHRTAKVTKISACGFTAHKAGTYELTQSVADSGSGPCITITADKVTLYLDSHTITGTGTDACLALVGSSSMLIKDTVIGGKMPKPGTKPKASKPATLTNCQVGVEIVYTSGATVSNLNIVAPAGTGAGVVAELAVGTTFSHINVPMHAATSATGFILQGGADNVVMDSTVNYDGSQQGFAVEEETGDTFLRDTVNDPYNPAGNAGTGFLDSHSARSTYSHCTSSGQANGFDMEPTEYGPVTLTYNSATGSPADPSSIGFKITGAFQYADSASPFHTLVSHNKTTGFGIGFEDDNGGVLAAPLAEKWLNNTAANYSSAGFVINSPADYVMTGNIADANASGKKYTGGSTYGFVLLGVSPAFPFASFSKNQAYDSQYGFYATGLGVGGKGNIAKRNLHNSFGVEISG